MPQVHTSISAVDIIDSSWFLSSKNIILSEAKKVIGISLSLTNSKPICTVAICDSEACVNISRFVSGKFHIFFEYISDVVTKKVFDFCEINFFEKSISIFLPANNLDCLGFSPVSLSRELLPAAKITPLCLIIGVF